MLVRNHMSLMPLHCIQMLTSLSALRMFVMLCILSCVSCWHVPRRTFSSFCAFSAASVLMDCAVDSCLTCAHNSASACNGSMHVSRAISLYAKFAWTSVSNMRYLVLCLSQS